MPDEIRKGGEVHGREVPTRDEAKEQQRLDGIQSAEELRAMGAVSEEVYLVALSLHYATPEEVQAARERIDQTGGLRPAPALLDRDDGERLGAIASKMESAPRALDPDGRDIRYLRILSKRALSPEAAEEAILAELRRRAPEEIRDALAKGYPSSEDGSNWPACGTCGDPIGTNATCSECVLREMGLGGGTPSKMEVWVCENGHVDDGHHGDPTINPDQLCSRCGGRCGGYPSLDAWARWHRELAEDRAAPVSDEPPYPAELLDDLASKVAIAVLHLTPMTDTKAKRSELVDALDRYSAEVGRENVSTLVARALAEGGL